MVSLPRRLRALTSPLVLAVDLSQPVADGASASPLLRATRPRPPLLRELLDAIADAADDPRVGALVARVDHPAASWAHAEELRGAILAFRRGGKRAIAHAQSFGERGDGSIAYAVAAAFDEVHLQPTGDLALLGVGAEVPFAAGLLAKLDLEPQVDHRHEYKSAANLLTEERFTDAHRERWTASSPPTTPSSWRPSPRDAAWRPPRRRR
jgi:protease IV